MRGAVSPSRSSETALRQSLESEGHTFIGPDEVLRELSCREVPRYQSAVLGPEVHHHQALRSSLTGASPGFGRGQKESWTPLLGGLSVGSLADVEVRTKG